MNSPICIVTVYYISQVSKEDFIKGCNLLSTLMSFEVNLNLHTCFDILHIVIKLQKYFCIHLVFPIIKTAIRSQASISKLKSDAIYILYINFEESFEIGIKVQLLFFMHLIDALDFDNYIFEFYLQ